RGRDLRVRDVADEDVPKRVLLVALDGRAPVAPHELLAFERAQRVVHVVARTARTEQRAAPEHLADDSGVLDQLLLRARQRVEARGDESLKRVGHGELAVRDGAAFGDEARELLRVEGVAARA